MDEEFPQKTEMSRRKFLQRCIVGGCGAVWGLYTVWDLLGEGGRSGLRVGFRNDAPARLDQWSKEADWYEVSESGDSPQVHCLLCPHSCILEENDRGFCRTRVVKNKRLYTVAYGNPCSVHLDPVEKKPLNHFLPGTEIFSLATAGCNLRCINCQNWEISQVRPEETENMDLPPEQVVAKTAENNIRSIAYTYSEPIVFYEYVYETATLARTRGIKNVLVTAGYIEPAPLRKLCKVTDAANVNIKGFTDHFYRKISSAKLAPILHAIEIMREEGVWVEITHLAIPTISDDLKEIREMCRWIVKALGPDVPIHFTRFHPAYRLLTLPLTPAETLYAARNIALEAGVRYTYIGNLPDNSAQDTFCPNCRRTVIERKGYLIRSNLLRNGRCPCGTPIPGVWA